MAELQVFLFGTVRIVHACATSPIRLTHTSQGLLAYLLLHRHRNHPRDALAALFWADRPDDRAYCCLNTALWRLRCAIEPDGAPRRTYLVTTPAGEVGFGSGSDSWLDVAVFETSIATLLARPAETLSSDDASTLEAALQLYTADLLEGFFDTWALHERERLRDLYISGLAYLMRYYRQHGAFEESLGCCRRILKQDPLREEYHREMMRLYLESGQRALAARQYEICYELLTAELGIAPMPETQAVYSQIVPQLARQPGAPPGRRAAPTHAQTLRKLRLALRACEKAREQLQRAMQLAESILDDPDSTVSQR